MFQRCSNTGHLVPAVHFHHIISTLLFVAISAHNFTIVVGSLGPYFIRENSPVVACLCSLSLHFVDWWHQQTHMSQTWDFLAIEAKWNIVCPGPQPSLPLGLWPRWTVIKQGCAESALHSSMPSHSHFLFLFMLLSCHFSSQWRAQPYVCFCIYPWCM